jgi:hypothetical protein
MEYSEIVSLEKRKKNAEEDADAALYVEIWNSCCLLLSQNRPPSFLRPLGSQCLTQLLKLRLQLASKAKP